MGVPSLTMSRGVHSVSTQCYWEAPRHFRIHCDRKPMPISTAVQFLTSLAAWIVLQSLSSSWKEVPRNQSVLIAIALTNVTPLTRRNARLLPPMK